MQISSFFFSPIFAIFVTYLFPVVPALNIVTGGKSHLDFQDPQNPEPAPPRFFASSTAIPKQRQSTFRGSRSADKIASGIELASTFARNVSRTRFDPELVRPDMINKFPPMFARLLASLSSNTRKTLEIDGAVRNTHQFEGDASYRRKRQANPITVSVTSESSSCRQTQSACHDFPFDALVPHEETILAFKSGKVYMMAPNGTTINGDPVDVQDIFPNARSNITAALRMKDHIYLFFGSTYMKFRPLRRAIASPEPLQISSGFLGVPTPVEGAFQLNHHTYVFLSGPKFVFYQPDADPPVNPKYSPNLLANIAEGPKNMTGVFNTPDGRRFMLGDDQLYELNDKMKVIKVQKSKRQLDGSGWLECVPIKSVACSNTTVIVQNLKPGFQVAFPDPSNTSIVEFPSGTVIVGSAGVPQAPQAGKANSGLNSQPLAPAEVSFAEISSVRLREQGTIQVPAGSIAIVHPVSSSKSSTSAEDTRKSEVKLVSSKEQRNKGSILSDDSDKVDDGEAFTVIGLKPPKSISTASTKKPHVVLKVNGTNMAQQLEEQGQVLRQLISKLDSLTHAISSIPVVPHSRVLKDLK